jgi:uncharacterized phage protein (TIGR01671 family)
MNKEIEFRAWDKENKKMFYWSFTEQGLYPQDLFNNDNYIVMQYTGLKDKNGKKIFEGDILGKKNPEWLKGYGGKYEMKLNEEIEDDYNSYIGYRRPEDGFEIIGNIYETKVSLGEGLNQFNIDMQTEI